MLSCFVIRLRYIATSLAFLALLSACGGEDEAFSASEVDDRYGADDVTTTPTSEPVEFADAPYSDEPYGFTGPTSIADIYSYFSDDLVWYGLSTEDEWPGGSGPCDTGGSVGNTPETVNQLPATIEGIVTLHPRYFFKASFCGSDERYYGSYFIEDSSGGIFVLKDSRVADFSYGDRVKLRVRGLLKFFDVEAVIIYDEEQVVSSDHEIEYQKVEDREFVTSDVGKVSRVRGKIASAATNDNFNEMCLVSPDDDSDEPCAKTCESSSDCESDNCVFPFQGAREGTCARDGGHWLVSLDRELGQRQPLKLEEGDVVEVTGPVLNSFGLRIIAMKLGQLKLIED